jgi:proline iminopeptidase
MLDVGDRYQVYWETCGNSYGKPALVLHDGPGSGCSPGSRRPFDPNVYRLVLFEGHVNRQIASDLDISVKTVEKHRQHLMEKLHHEIAGLTRYAMAAGVIESSVHQTIA